MKTFDILKEVKVTKQISTKELKTAIAKQKNLQRVRSRWFPTAY